MTEEADTGVYEEAAAPVENGQVEAQGEEQKDHMVPLDALQSERSQRQALQDELKMMKDHLALMQSQQQTQKPQSKDEMDSLDESDVLTVGEFKRALQKKEQQYNASLEEMKMMQRHPDYQEVVTKYLPEVLKQNPSLRNALEKTQDYELAYHLAKNSDAYKEQTKQKKKSSDAERILKNTQQSGSLASLGQNSPINTAKRYREMSDSDFMKEVHRNMGHF